MNLDYYGAKDIQEITGCKKTFAYELIRKLQNSFKKEYPNVITIQGRIPKWYFEKIMINKKGDRYEEGKN